MPKTINKIPIIRLTLYVTEGVKYRFNCFANTILKQLTWLKTGEWKSELGGLNSRTTNQLFIEVPTNTNLNYLFLKN